ncbi:MAG: hypothetical protein COY40_02030 [Alphaproteobacteria bacterium CG_4_10_14_0_8_um_filter_53_9]|nr:MAG: hypothetical protein COY40_02030 [Alphaproteobacteria bacterium CG_4_10_14_0_8_um_filter_53_9]
MWHTLTQPSGAQLPVWRVTPTHPNGAALVLMHEAFRVTAHIKDMCSFFASHGYEVMAPDMLAHSAPATEALPINKHGLEEARRLISAVPWETYLEQIQTCVDELLPKKVGLIGYCFGGSMAYYGGSHCKGVSAVDSYYGGFIAELAEKEQPACPTQAHLATHDRYIPYQSALEALATHHPAAKVFTYEADHGFNRTDGVTYDDAAATLARTRSLDFFAKNLLTN